MIYRLMYRGAAYADSLQYHHCIGESFMKSFNYLVEEAVGFLEKIILTLSPDLWKYALELRIAKDTILYCDTCFTAQVTTKCFTRPTHIYMVDT